MKGSEFFIGRSVAIKLVEEFRRVACGVHIAEPVLKIRMKNGPDRPCGSIGHLDVTISGGALTTPLADLAGVIRMLGLEGFNLKPMSTQYLELEGTKFLEE
jgi:hypothetical protein